MDYPDVRWPPLNVITPYHPDSIGLALRGSGTGALSGATSAAVVADLAWFYPFRLWHHVGAFKMSVVVGATNTGNIDMGIYDSEKHRLVNTGSTALGTANTLQEISLGAGLAMAPGLYFMALQCSNAAGTLFGNGRSDEMMLAMVPIYEQAVGSFGLPATAAWVPSTQTSVSIWAMGVHFTTLI